MLGQTVGFIRNGETVTALADSIDDDGSLIVRTENGIERLRSGEISIIR